MGLKLDISVAESFFLYIGTTIAVFKETGNTPATKHIFVISHKQFKKIVWDFLKTCTEISSIPVLVSFRDNIRWHSQLGHE